MLHRAVADYNKPKDNCNSKGSTQTNIPQAFKSSQRPGSSKKNRLQALSVESFTTPKEGLPSPPARGPVNLYKQSSEKDSGLFRALSRNESALFQENAPPTNVHSAPTNLTPSLHETVYIDEDDFDRDSQLSLAFDEPQLPSDEEAAVAGLKPQQSQEILLPQAQVDIPGSSAPLPWSSSPVPSFQPMAAPKPPIAKASSRGSVGHIGNITTNKNVSAPRPAQEKLKAEGKPKRQLPFTKMYCMEEPETKKPRGRKPKLSHTVIEAPQKNPDMLWNATASQVKDAQKKLKADTRKKPLPSTRGGMKKGSSKTTSLKLSEEQLNVIHLAVEGEKSVFFTGSAG